MTGTAQSENAYPLPLTAKGVTATWVGAGLRTRQPGVVVTEAEQVQTIEGTATKILVRLAYGRNTRLDGLPDRMWIKGGFAAHREYVGALGVYASTRTVVGRRPSAAARCGAGVARSDRRAYERDLLGHYLKALATFA